MEAGQMILAIITAIASVLVLGMIFESMWEAGE